jgi:hypothetical protein
MPPATARAFFTAASACDKISRGRGQPHGFRAALKQGKADLVFEVADLAADARLRDVQLERGAGDVFLPGHGDKVTEMA